MKEKSVLNLNNESFKNTYTQEDIENMAIEEAICNEIELRKTSKLDELDVNDPKNSKVLQMALNIFLGLSIGNWVATTIPTLDYPELTLEYKGKQKGGRPFKILNTAARPPKKYRPTMYWAMTLVDLENQVIKFYKLKQNVSARDVYVDFYECVKNAQNILKHRKSISEKMKKNPSNPNAELKRSARKLVKTLYNEDTKFECVRFEGTNDFTVLLLGPENDLDGTRPILNRFTDSTEKGAYLMAIAGITSRKIPLQKAS